MTGSLRTLLTLGAIGASLLLGGMARAQSIGAMRMPSTAAQYFGVGYGAGHHAPLVRTPAQHPERLRRATYVPPCYGQLGPACYGLMGCYGGGCYQGPAGPAPMPAPTVQNGPTSAPAMQGPMVYQPQPPMARRWAPGYAVR